MSELGTTFSIFYQLYGGLFHFTASFPAVVFSFAFQTVTQIVARYFYIVKVCFIWVRVVLFCFFHSGDYGVLVLRL
ncbi:hypothetical protein QBC43DRAFT_308651 [Cladorrhinum sp. PSN259]|nr:hypothetical protein QBC43DRAFT_308651 [Cladorrhinum sp. PSN259]